MKTVTLATALMLLLSLPFAGFAQEENRGLFGRGGSSADYDYSGGESLMRVGEPNTYGTITNDSFGDSPLGSGLAILIAAGAGYAIVRRKRTRKNTMLLLACVALLGLTQCKKEQPLEPDTQGEKVNITLNVENGGKATDGSKVDVTDNHVAFEKGDKVLVGYDGAYVGTLTHNGTQFAGTIDASVNGIKKLYFYFVGNKNTGALTAGSTTSCTVNISDQTNELPVLSFSESYEDFTGAGSYSASLHNQCALVKFTLANPAGLTQVGGMHTEATISFATPGITPTGTTGSVRLYSKTNTEKWAILLPQTAANNAAVTIGSQNLTVDVPAIAANDYITDIPAIANSSAVLDLSTVTDESSDEDRTAKDGWVITGTLGVNKQIMIADGATVMLDNTVIQPQGMSFDSWAGITCLGDATIILKDGTSNTATAFGMMSSYPGIFIPSGKTLTINGNTGSLEASSESGAGIGGSYNADCGNIVINGGSITAYSEMSAGIGSGNDGSCGDININGGAVFAQSYQEVGIGCGYNGSCDNIIITGGNVTASGENGPGIGSSDKGYCLDITINGGTVSSTTRHSAGIGGYYCGDITITSGVTQVTARCINGYQSIGKSYSGAICGTVRIGNTIGAINASSYTYPTPVPAGPLDKKFSVSSTDKVYFSHGNLQATYNGTSWSWNFAANDYVFIGNAVGNTSVTNSNPWISEIGTVDLFGFSSSSTYFGINSSTENSDYSGDFVDWGTLSIGSNAANTWRTLTREEWIYLFNTRADSYNKYASATVAGTHGIVIVPDNWMVPDGLIFNPGQDYHFGWDYNLYTAEQWEVMKESGAMFLPTAGYRSGITVNSLGTYDYGYYRSSNSESVYLHFDKDNLTPNTAGSARYGYSVRLVCDAN